MHASKKIRVLVVDDSIVFREALSRCISSDPLIEIAGTAANPFEARDKIIKCDPDVVICDVEMPGMNGIEFIRRLMPQYPLPVVVVSAASEAVFDAMKAGAVDFIAKPGIVTARSIDAFINELIIKIKIASTVNLSYRKNREASRSAGGMKKTVEAVAAGENANAGIAGSASNAGSAGITGSKGGTWNPGNSGNAGSAGSAGCGRSGMLIAIGASTGGTEAICRILEELPVNVPGIVVVQHIPPVFSRMYAERLDSATRFKAREARTGDFVESGLVLVAPGDEHMRIRKSGERYKVECFKGDKVNGHCPSIDILFESVAREAGNRAIGLILTGMGCDGAKGLLSMRRRGARTIGQDEKTSAVYGMPKVAYDIGAVERQIPLENISHVVVSMLG